MARKVLIEGYGYSFNPATRAVTIQKFIPEERLILITNVSKNKVIYNFSDPSLGYSNYQTAFDPTTGNEQTIVTLVYDTTSGMEAGNQLQILIDEDSQLITPAQTYMDPTNKMRITQPQALIDTDFEYGTQYSKWEAAGLIGNRPYFFPSATQIPNITSIAQPIGTTKSVTVTTSSAHGLIVGTPVVVIDTFFGPANGNFVVDTVPSTTTFTYTSRAVNNTNTVELLDANKTALYQGSIFANAQIGTAPSAITYDANVGSVTVTTSIPHGLALGNEIAMIGTAGLTAGTSGLTGGAITINGNYIVNQITSATQFVYHAPAGFAGTLRGAFGTASVTSTTAASFPANTIVTSTITLSSFSAGVITDLQVGQNITGTNIAPGTVINAISLNAAGTVATLTLSNVTTGLLSGTTVNVFGAIYVRPQAQTNHRPFDGGVLFSNNSLSNFSTNIRQSRRYFRYQSGKGIMVSSGTILKPYSGLDQVTSGGTVTNVVGGGVNATYTLPFHNFVPGQTVTVTGVNPSGYNLTGQIVGVGNMGTATANFTLATALTSSYVSGGYAGSATYTVQTKERHNLVPGTVVVMTGASETNYNGTWTVSQILGWNRYQVTGTNVPTVSPAPGNPAVSVNSWSGSSTRLGMFDNQNGVFFEFDGTTLNAVRRSSTFQLAGKVTVAFGSSYVEQTDATFATQFGSQLQPGDYVVIRGFSYRVTDIMSNSQLLISPQYRGANAQFVTVSKTIDTRIPQSQWNLDRMDGTGNSGYVVDLSKMQMFYIDYTWYGAGFIRWGLRGVKGDVTYAHKLPNNNVNTEAYMRSGNLPARYEINNNAPITVLSGTIDASQQSIPVSDTSKFPSSGTIVVRQVSLTQPTGTVTGVSTSGGVATYTTSVTTGIVAGTPIKITGLTGTGSAAFNGTFIVNSVSASTNFTVITSNTLAVALTLQTAPWTANSYTTTIEYMNYTGKTSTSFTGVTRARTGAATNGSASTLTIAANTSVGTVSNASILQAGMRVVGSNAAGILAIPENTFIVSINGSTVTLNNAVTAANPSVYYVPMGAGTGQVFNNITTNPVEVELAYPTFSPAISHWGTSVIMDGRYDDDKSLLFTYGQQQQTQLGTFSGYFPLSEISGNGTITTYSTADTTGLIAGNPIAITGSNITGYNGNFTIISVTPNTSFTVANTATGTATGTPRGIATFGTPAVAQFATNTNGTTITVPNLNSICVGQTVSGDTTRFPQGTSYKITNVATSQIANIQSISASTNLTTSATASTGASGVVTYTTTSTTGIFPGQYITITGSSITEFNGTFIVNTVPNATTFTVINPIAGATGFTTDSGTKVYRVYTTVYTGTGTNPAEFQTANRYVTISGAYTTAYNGTFITVAAASNTFTVVTQFPVTGASSTANAIMYTATLSNALAGGAAAIYQQINLYGANQKALFSIRIAPSADNGVPATLGAREVINRMQLFLRSLGVTTTVPATGNPPINLLTQAILNGTPSSTTAWTSVTRNQVGVANSSLSMIADYAGSNTTVSGGEITGGFVTDGTGTLDLAAVRDLGNSILGGGGTTSNTNIFPDGPDTLTIVATNLSAVPLLVAGRLSWSEAQA